MINANTINARLRALGIRPPVVAAVALILAAGVNQLVPGPKIIGSPAVLYLAVFLWTVGLVLGVSALGLFHRNRTTHDPFGTPSSLAVSGPYRLSRNPMYVGVTLILLGVAFSRGTAAYFLAPVGFVLLINAYFIPGEERLLEQLFGDDFRAYKQHVRRWL